MRNASLGASIGASLAASLSSIDACQFDLHHIYNSLTLLAHLSSLANEFNYAELLLKDR